MTGGAVVWDGTINLGNLLTMFFGAVVWSITIAIAWTKFGGRMDMLEFRVKLVETALLDISTVLKKFTTNEADMLLLKAQVVALEQDFAALNTTVELLRRGDGYITTSRRNSVDGEYN